MSSKSNYAQVRWSKSDLYAAPDSPELKTAFKKMEELASEFEGIRPKLKNDLPGKVFLEIIKKLDVKYGRSKISHLAKKRRN